LLKEKLVNAFVVIAPDWSLPFKLMCDASDLAVGTILGQRKNKVFHTIYYASRTLDAQKNYTTTKNELLVVVFAFDKFRHYLVLSIVAFTDHFAIKFLMSKQDPKPNFIRWTCCYKSLTWKLKTKRCPKI